MINKENKKMLYFINSIWRIRMKTIRTISVPAFSVMLLLSCAVAQSMDRSFLDVDNAVGSPITITSAVKGAMATAGKFVAKKAEDVWAKMPDKTQAGVMIEDALGELEFNTIVKHPYLTTAVVATPTAIAAGVVAKNAIQNARAKKALVAAIDLDLLEQVERLAQGFGKQVLDSLKERKALLGAKIPGRLNFEETLEPVIDLVPKTLVALNEAWNDFVAMATAYDRSKNYEQVGLVTTALNKVLDELEALYGLHAEQQAPSTLTVAKNNVVNAAVAAKNAVVAHPRPVVAVAAAAVAAPVVAKSGLVGKAIAFYNSIDKKALVNNVAEKAVTMYSNYQPVVTKAVSKGLQFAKSHKGKLGAAAAVGGGLYGMHHFLNKDEVLANTPVQEKQVAVEEALVAEVAQPVDSNSQMIGF